MIPLQKSAYSSLIDTNTFIKALQASSFTPEQSKAISDLLAKTFASSLGKVETGAISNAEFQRSLHQQSTLLTKAKNEMQIKQSAELIQAKASLSQLQRELRSGRQKARESLNHLRSELRLDLSIEKGKQRDSALGHLIRFEDVRGRIDGEVANGYVGLGKLRHDIFYSMTGFFFTSVAALFGYLRYIA